MAYARSALQALVAQPSVSAEGRGLEATVQVLVGQLKALGLTTRVIATPGAPVVLAEGGSQGPTVLFYNHYDVQPADPLELWQSDPWVLTERDGHWYARGASDDKGEIVARMAALKSILEEHGHLPFRLKWLIEGEEEVGSTHLSDFVAQYRDDLACDAVLWESGGLDAAGRPIIYCGVKGILALELRVSTAGYDLHSSYGAVVENPIYRLSAALASMRNPQGRVLIPGFYDQVRPLTPREEEAMAQIPDESAQLGTLFGVEGFLEEASGTAFYRRLLGQPCLNFNGFHSGYGGPGSKTVLPAQAMAKLDIRLVPDQDPDQILHALRQHLQHSGFADIEVVVLEMGEHPARSDLDHRWVRQAAESLGRVYGVAPVVTPNMTGTGPMYPFSHFLGAPVIGFGIGYPGTRVHSPNENIRIADFERGIRGIRALLEDFARSQS